MFIVAALVSNLACAQTSYYQCVDERGNPVFSQKPCGDDAQKKLIDTQPGIEAQSAVREEGEENKEETWDRISLENELRSLDRRIARGEAKSRQLTASMNKKIDQLEAERNNIPYSYPGNAREVLYEQVRIVRRDMGAKIRAEDDAVHQLRLEKISVEGELDRLNIRSSWGD